MNKILFTLGLLALTTSALGAVVLKDGTTAQGKFQALGFYLDSLGQPLGDAIQATDSFKIKVFGPSGFAFAAKMISTDARLLDTVIDGEAMLFFFDDWQDIDSSLGVGKYTVLTSIWDNSLALWTPYRDHVYRSTEGLSTALDSIGLAAVGVAEVRAYMDTLIYIGEHGMGVFVDSTAGNTNTVIGTDGTEKNPVSTLAAARTVALALGAHRFYIHGGSTFNGATTDLGADYSEWEFYGEGFGIEIAFGGQLVTNSYFQNVKLSGAMHASGGDVHYVDCSFGYISSNFNGHADNCELLDTIVFKASSTISFDKCFSGATGANVPTLDYSAGASEIEMNGYSGELRLMNGSSNDSATIGMDGELIISANNTSLFVKAFGFIEIDDSGTTTIMIKDAVFSRKEADEWVWANVDTLKLDTSLLAEWLTTNEVSANITAISGDAAAADSLELALDGTAITIREYLRMIGEYVGAACDTTFQKLWPLAGSAPKDSVQIFCNDIDEVSPTLVRTIIFFKTSGVVDSVVSYRR